MRAIIAAILLVIAHSAWADEKFAGSNVDVRTVIAFKASQGAVQKLLPGGWELNPPTAGPSKNFTLGVILVDQLIAQDPEGKSVDPIHGAVLFAPVKNPADGSAGAMVLSGLMSPASGVPGAYGVYTLARPEIERTIHLQPDGTSVVKEAWHFTSAEDSLAFAAEYTRRPMLRAKAEAKIFSVAKPGFYRIYRFEQATDVIRSSETGTDRFKTISFKASGPKFAAVFDGNEQLISVTSIPWYARLVFLPRS